MILPPLRYLRPASLPHAIELLARTDGAAVLAGGQTLINALKLDLVQPTALVDIHRLDELRNIAVSPDGTLVLGAAVTYARLAASPEVASVQPTLAAMAAGTADRQVRNRGTIGGNCCLNDPTSNFPPLLTALQARLRIIGPGGERVVAADDFFTGTLATALTRDEILMAVEVPPLPAGARVAQRHLQVGADAWALARAVVRLDIDTAGRAAAPVVTSARVVAGAVLGSPRRLTTVERSLAGRPADATLVAVAAEAFDREKIETVSDLHCSAHYRRDMCKVQVRRAVADAIDGSC